MNSHLTSTGGGRGHRPGCQCSFCLSAVTTGEVDLDLDLSATGNGSGSGAGFGLGAPSSASGPNPAHAAIFTEALARIGRQRDLARSDIKRTGRAVIAVSAISRGDRIVLPGTKNGRLAVAVSADPVHEENGLRVKFRQPMGFYDDHTYFDPYDDVTATHIDALATGRAARISADRIRVGNVIADEDGEFVEVREVNPRGFLPSDPVFIRGHYDSGTDREFAYLRRDEVPISEFAPLEATA